MLSLQFLLLSLLPAVLGLRIPGSDTISSKPASMKRETLAEAAINAKRLVHTYTTGTMASVFPAESEYAGHPFALMEYHAPCHLSPSLTFLLLPISQSVRNILASPEHFASYTITMPPPIDKKGSAMSRGRVAFVGNITFLPSHTLTPKEDQALSKCYTSYHPDSKAWLPSAPDSPHMSIWARMDIEDIYYVGGFGDVHYIGHIPIDMYAKAGEKDIFDSTFSIQDQD